MNILLILAFMALTFGYILPNHYVPWVSFYHEAVAFAAGLLLLAALLWIKPPQRLRLPVAYLWLALLASVPVLQYAAGLIYFWGDALNGIIYILFLTAMLFAGYNLAQSNQLRPALLQYLAAVLIFAGIVSVWLALYQWFLQPSVLWVADLRPGGRPFANLAQPNHLATLLSLALASVLYLYEKHWLNRISSSVLAVLFLFAVALTQSRTPWLMAIFFIVFWVWKNHGGEHRLSFTWALVWTALYGCFVFVLPHIAELLGLGSLSTVAERAQAYNRWPLYTQFVHAIVDGPLWGYGWQQGGIAQLMVASFYERMEYSEYAHNILLDLLVWNGPVLGLLVILLVALYVLRLAFLARTTDSVYAMLAIGFFLLHSLLEYPHAYAYFLLPVGLLAGSVQAEFSCKTWPVPKWLLGGLVVSAAGLYAVIWHEYRVIEEDFRLLRFEKGRIGTLKADKPAPDVLLLTQLQALTRHARLPATTGLSEEELEENAKVARRFSQGPSIYKYIQVLALNNELQQAYEQLIILRNLHGKDFYEQAVHGLEQQETAHPKIGLLLAKLRSEGGRDSSGAGCDR